MQEFDNWMRKINIVDTNLSLSFKNTNIIALLNALENSSLPFDKSADPIPQNMVINIVTVFKIIEEPQYKVAFGQKFSDYLRSEYLVASKKPTKSKD